MNIEERMAKAETDIAVLKETQRALIQGQANLHTSLEALRTKMDEGFAEQRGALDSGLAEQRSAIQALGTKIDQALSEIRGAIVETNARMDQGFAEERAARESAISELRRESQRAFRWTFGASLSILALVAGIFARLAGVM